MDRPVVNSLVSQDLKSRLGLRHLIGGNPEFLGEVNKIPKVADFDITVLITGETGTGKEVFARAIHYLSRRADKPFVPVNCGAIPPDLVENELFGHEQGAYTNAAVAKPGLVLEAEGGTIFLDEIDCLPPLAQVKLLRFLQEREYRPLGSVKALKSNVRVIAATNVETEKALNDGRFRKDLYYRLNVIQLTLPSLKQRCDDIPLLARHFLSKYSKEFNKPVADISAEAIDLLMMYDWPGNVRELENIIERAVVLSEHTAIQAGDITLPTAIPTKASQLSFNDRKRQVVSHFERSYIHELLAASKGNITRAARSAKKNRRSFLELMHKHGINKSSLLGFIPIFSHLFADFIF